MEQTQHCQRGMLGRDPGYGHCYPIPRSSWGWGGGGGQGWDPGAPSLSTCLPLPPVPHRLLSLASFFSQAGMTVEEEGQYRSSWWYSASEGQLLDLTMRLLQHLCLAIIAHTLVV